MTPKDPDNSTEESNEFDQATRGRNSKKTGKSEKRLESLDRMVAIDQNFAVIEFTPEFAAVEAEVTPYLSCAPGAVAESKALLRALGPAITDTEIDLSIAALVTRWESAESSEGIDAFFSKRKAAWMVDAG